MKLEDKLWLEGAFYIDHSPSGELRVVGHGNHLYYGAFGLYHDQVRLLDVRPNGDEIELELEITPIADLIPDPAMGHIRRVRQYSQRNHHPDRNFTEIEQLHPGELRPNRITTESRGNAHIITYLRSYGSHYYGTRLEWSGDTIRRDDDRQGFSVNRSSTIRVKLTTITDAHLPAYAGPLLQNPSDELARLSPYWRAYGMSLLDRTAAEIDHLVRHGKTSGFDYGTVFPRDWMEAADLLGDDLTPEGRCYMYARSRQHINNAGTGWHEDIVGEFKYERDEELARLSQNFNDFVAHDHPLAHKFQELTKELDEMLIRRHMIDIEPRYLLGLETIPPQTLTPEDLTRLQRVARFVARRAESCDLITFNKVALPFRRQRGDEYYLKGNWRDSDYAFQQIDPVIAPFDVNVVFYPEALHIMRRHHQLLEIDAARLDQLITKWSRVRNWYRFTNPDGLTAYALALYGIRPEGGEFHYQTMAVNHLDEASDLFYAQPTPADVLSFAQRLLSPQYFYTASGPILVGRGQGYDQSYYHGEVIWAKQAAYAVAGLERQLERGRREHWPAATLKTIHEALIRTAETSLQAFRTLGAIPEVHYDDAGTPRLYNDQPHPEGVMNTVQLWSAAGARRILLAYAAHTATQTTLSVQPQM